MSCGKRWRGTPHGTTFLEQKPSELGPEGEEGPHRRAENENGLGHLGHLGHLAVSNRSRGEVWPGQPEGVSVSVSTNRQPQGRIRRCPSPRPALFQKRQCLSDLRQSPTSTRTARSTGPRPRAGCEYHEFPRGSRSCQQPPHPLVQRDRDMLSETCSTLSLSYEHFPIMTRTW